eukprot:scaffold2294_cov106-Cylindrotheca_fusiformis.AAC.20
MEKMVVGMNEDTKKDDDEEEEASLCPLFMEGLPKDFASNPQLAAIASLLEVDEDVEEEQQQQVPKSRPIGKKHDEEKPSAKVTTAAGGGKAKRLKQQQRQLRNSTTPYPSQAAIRGKKKASLGEAQLFLNMWKI